MAGSMSEEGWLFVMELFPKALSKIEYDGIIRVLFGSRKNKKAVLDMYVCVLLFVFAFSPLSSPPIPILKTSHHQRGHGY